MWQSDFLTVPHFDLHDIFTSRSLATGIAGGRLTDEGNPHAEGMVVPNSSESGNRAALPSNLPQPGDNRAVLPPNLPDPGSRAVTLPNNDRQPRQQPAMPAMPAVSVPSNSDLRDVFAKWHIHVKFLKDAPYEHAKHHLRSVQGFQVHIRLYSSITSSYRKSLQCVISCMKGPPRIT